MSQTEILMLIVALATTTSLGISYLAKLGFFEKAAQMKPAKENSNLPLP